MDNSLALIGFGEAGRAFATAGHWSSSAHVYDCKADMADYYAQAGVTGSPSLAQAVQGKPLVLSLVTADQALVAARDCAAHIAAGALYCDMNSVAPDTKKSGAKALEQAGGRYVDVAVMAPVHPALMQVPLLVSGPHAEAGAAALIALGFHHVRVVGDRVGQASAIKMIRSVIIKGIEALTAESILAADKAGVLDDVVGSLGGDWADKIDYNIDRMMVHGLRRAAEMEEVVKTLDSLGIDPVMTRGTVARQRAIGSLGLVPDTGLQAKLSQLRHAQE